MLTMIYNNYGNKQVPINDVVVSMYINVYIYLHFLLVRIIVENLLY